MAQDEKLNERIRDILDDYEDIREQPMFGGVCFMDRGNMLLGADQNGLMVRVGADSYDACLKLKHASELKITKRPMKGLVSVAHEGIKTKAQLRKWIERAFAFTSTLPEKVKKGM